MMKPFRRLINREEAMKLIEENVSPIIETELIPLIEAGHRVLAEDIKADFNVPPFDRSSMDGYAVRAQDTFQAGQFNPVNLNLIGVQHAGEIYQGIIEEKECVQIATGSPIPKGANAVVMVEYTKRRDESIDVTRPVYPGANIAKAGEDIEKGEIVMTKGEHLTPARIGALAALGKMNATIYRKPRVAIFSTGPEIVPQGKPLEQGKIYDINSFTLNTVVASNGGDPFKGEIVDDNRKAIEEAIEKITEFDLMVFSGGSSVGVRDVLSTVIQDKGEIIFHGVQIKPGKPTLFGKIEDTPIFGMPGYPTSCLSNAYIFLIPTLRKLSGLPKWKPNIIRARMGHRIVSGSGREQFLTIRLEDTTAHVAYKHSGDITSMAHADGYIILPINQDTLEEGEEVKVYLLE
jgi:molybdenum cofactor synthesis domain-containing protein